MHTIPLDKENLNTDCSVWNGSREEYDNIEEKEPNKFYIINDELGLPSGNIYVNNEPINSSCGHGILRYDGDDHVLSDGVDVNITNEIEKLKERLDRTENYAISASSSVNVDINTEIEKIKERLNKTITMVHNCNNCGARLNVEENQAIVHCKYCGTAYIIGPARTMSTY